MRRPLLIVLAALGACTAPALLVRDVLPPPAVGDTLAAPDPGRAGTFTVRSLYYGSGTDRRRAEYRDSVTLKTRAVNGTPFVRGGDPKRLKARWKYWGFNEKAMPVNGRVWYPEGAGPFPLVLIVHGNHSMKEYSDPGYAYLGQLFASRGYIFASVDENFLNGDLRNENDARGWMLLQHLRAWRGFSSDSASPLRGKVDLSKIVLMGHSRGGEAVAVAAAFNRLSRYPDDARVTFDFGFDIRGLVAIAPVDGQYRPADQPTPLRDVSYLVLHGAHDSDVSSFMGLRQYLRVQLSPGSDAFKASLYINRANHGQFNTVWGDNDVGPYGWMLRKSTLLTGTEQRRIGAVYIGAFLEAVLHSDVRYRPMFEDHRRVRGWLPNTIYLSRYEAPGTARVADFEGDVDVTTGVTRGVHLRGEGLAAWREFTPVMRSRGGSSFGTGVVALGWETRKDSANTPAPTYTVTMDDSVVARLGLTDASRLVWAAGSLGQRASTLPVSDTGAVAGPPPERKEPQAKQETKKSADAPKPKSKGAAAADSLPLDFTIELVLADGRVAAVPLSEVLPLQEPLTIRLWRWKYVEKRANPPAKDHEDVPQQFIVPLSRFAAALPGFSPSAVRAIRFRFDRGRGGTILVDDIGFDRLGAR